MAVSPKLTASGLQRAALCPPSAILEHVQDIPEDPNLGTEFHEIMSGEADMELVSQEAKNLADSLDWSEMPFEQGDVRTEVTYVLDVNIWGARELGSNLGRKYEGLLDGEIAGTLDVGALMSDGEGVFVADYKTGHSDVEPAATNLQLIFLGICAALVHGRRYAQIEILKIGANGRVFRDAHRFEVNPDSPEWKLLKTVIERVLNDAENGVWNYKSGGHCKYCPAFRFCPVQAGLAKTIGTGELEEVLAEALTIETAGKAWERIEAYELVIKKVKDSIKTLAAQTNIPLPSGKTLGRTVEAHESLDVNVVKKVFSEYGEAAYNMAIETSTSKAAVKRALRPLAKQLEEPMAKLEEFVFKNIRAQKGIDVRRVTKIKVF